MSRETLELGIELAKITGSLLVTTAIFIYFVLRLVVFRAITLATNALRQDIENHYVKRESFDEIVRRLQLLEEME